MEAKNSYIMLLGILISSIFFYLSIIFLQSQNSSRISEMKLYNMDLSVPYLGIKPEALRYLYSMKQGIVQSGKATVTLRGRLIDIGPHEQVGFRIHLRHVTDAFENTITPDEYKDALIQIKSPTSGKVSVTSYEDLHPEEFIEIEMDLDLITAKEYIRTITVFRED